jgi:CheY-like chemotaxis protein
VEADDGIEALPAVQADRTRLKQVLLNLLSNAVKYNEAGGRVTVGAQVSGDRLRIAVTDTGTGIAGELQEQLFEPFSRLGMEGTKIEGTGIGLTITRQLVDLMGGAIGVDSEVGRGSTFWIELPVAAGTAARAEAAARGAPEAELAPATENPARLVLYVEDNPANLRLIEEIIGHVPDLRMISAHNAELGLDLARQRRPDLILMDINLPGMDGVQALEALRRDETTRDIPVVAISDAAMPGDL